MIPDLQYDIIIVGAGVAGLSAGLELYEKKVNFLVLEASNEILGRVKTKYDFADFPIELGAEYVHGLNNDFYYLAKNYIQKINGSFIKNDYGELYWVPSLQKLLEYDDIMKIKPGNLGKELKEVLKFEKIIENYDEENDISIKDYKDTFLKNNQFKEVFPTLCSHDKGAGETETGMYGQQEDDENWGLPTDPPYDEFLLKKGNFGELFNMHFEKILDRVVKNSQVTEIDYQNDLIQISLQNGLKYTCNQVIVTVSLGILKSGMVKFTPALPTEKQEAIKSLGFSGGIKVFFKFKKPLWPKDTLFVFSNGEGVIPIFWVTSAGGRSKKDIVLTGFFMGNEAEAYAQKSEVLVSKVKSQISRLFDVSEKQLEENILGIFVQNWSEDPFIRGGYSFISLNNAYKDFRKKLAQSVVQKVYFAGEATSINFSSTVQGGISTGKTAAVQAIKDGKIKK